MVRSTSNATTQLLIGAVVWAYLGILFEFSRDGGVGALGGDDQYTFMAPLSRGDAPRGAVLRGALWLIRAIIPLIVVAFFFDLELPELISLATFIVLVVGSVAFIDQDHDHGAAADRPEGAFGFVARDAVVVSGVYYARSRCCRGGCSGSR